eukprot:m.180511 g.180511  ORF g.180511 m.180511 type:complete len:190 (-) comp32023_c1_seq1:2276-2845(-)
MRPGTSAVRFLLPQICFRLGVVTIMTQNKKHTKVYVSSVNVTCTKQTLVHINTTTRVDGDGDGGVVVVVMVAVVMVVMMVVGSAWYQTLSDPLSHNISTWCICIRVRVCIYASVYVCVSVWNLVRHNRVLGVSLTVFEGFFDTKLEGVLTRSSLVATIVINNSEVGQSGVEIDSDGFASFHVHSFKPKQ